jgi:hypothetical protein
MTSVGAGHDRTRVFVELLGGADDLDGIDDREIEDLLNMRQKLVEPSVAAPMPADRANDEDELEQRVDYAH